MRNKGLFIFIIIMMLSLAAGCSDASSENGAEGKKTKMIIIQEDSQDHIKGFGIDMMKDLINERLGDELEVEVYHSGSLYNIEEGLEALQANNVQMVVGSTSKLKGFDPAYQLYDLPFLFTSKEQFYEFYNSDLGKELNSKIEANGLKILDTWAGSQSQLTNSKKPIESPEDMDGLKFRVMSGGLLADQFQMLGAGATVIPFTDLYMSLQQGVVDGQENPFLEIENANLYEVQDYMTISNHKLSTYPLVTSEEFWSSLPKDVQEELETILIEVNEAVSKKVDDFEQEAFNVIKEESDMEIIELTDEQQNEFKEALQPLYDDYADEIGDKFIEGALKLQN